MYPTPQDHNLILSSLLLLPSSPIHGGQRTCFCCQGGHSSTVPTPPPSVGPRGGPRRRSRRRSSHRSSARLARSRPRHRRRRRGYQRSSARPARRWSTTAVAIDFRPPSHSRPPWPLVLLPSLPRRHELRSMEAARAQPWRSWRGRSHAWQCEGAGAVGTSSHAGATWL
jgi:hypothetical protein